MRLTDRQRRLLDRFLKHAGGDSNPTRETFLEFGSLSRLGALMPAIEAEFPAWAPELRAALHLRYAEKWRKTRNGVKRRPPGRKSQVAVPFDQLPKRWRHAIREMELAREQIDRGILTLDDRVPPSLKVIANLKCAARQLAFAAQEAGLEPELDMPSVRAFLIASTGRGTRAVTRAARLKELMTLARWIDEDAHADVIDAMRRKKCQLERLAKRQRKRKEDWLLRTPIRVVDCWMRAEDLLQEALSAPPGSVERLDLALHAVAIALAVNIPLRIGDLHRLQIGVHLTRSLARGTWSVDLRCEKLGNGYVAELWPELTPFLDAVVLAGRPPGALVERIRDLDGQCLFSRHGRKLGDTWISTVWRRHIGIGEHIIRTIWHEEALDDADTWMALVICGQQGGTSTARHYQVKQERRQARRRAKSLLRSARNRRLPSSGRR